MLGDVVEWDVIFVCVSLNNDFWKKCLIVGLIYKSNLIGIYCNFEIEDRNMMYL